MIVLSVLIEVNHLQIPKGNIRAEDYISYAQHICRHTHHRLDTEKYVLLNREYLIDVVEESLSEESLHNYTARVLSIKIANRMCDIIKEFNSNLI